MQAIVRHIYIFGGGFSIRTEVRHTVKIRKRFVDTLQFIGILLGLLLAVVLIFPANQDPIGSAILGLGLTILFQLFDLQLRQNASEERILAANALSQLLYKDEWLFKIIRDVVGDYTSVKNGWFELYSRRAEDALLECRNILRSMAEGHLDAPLNSPYEFGIPGVESASKLVKAVDVGDAAQWEDAVGEKYVIANSDAIKRGVKITRVFIQSRETIRDMVRILERQKSLGVQVYAALLEDLPRELNEDYIIIDDRVCVRFELAGDRQAREEKISINEVEVARMNRKFEKLLMHSRKLEELTATLN